MIKRQSVVSIVAVIAVALAIVALTVVGKLHNGSGPTPTEKSTANIEDALVAAVPLKIVHGQSTLLQGFEESRDLFAFYQRLDKQVASASEVIWLKRRIRDYCRGFSENPADYARNTESLAVIAAETSRSYLLAARNRVASRCAGFAGSAFSQSEDLQMLSEAAKAGSVTAEAELLSRGMPLSRDRAYTSDLIRRIAASDDPEAYLAISSAMGVPVSGEPQVYGRVSGTNEAVYAWQLAACERGLNCTSEGSLMTAYCANGGACGNYSTLRQMIEQGFIPRDQQGVLNDYVRSINNLE